MYIKTALLLSQLEKLRAKEMPHFLFNMVNEVLEQRFLPIKAYDVKLNWAALFVWDNVRELLHGPFQVKGSILGSYAFIEDYKWIDGEFYVYFPGQNDHVIRGLEDGKAIFMAV